MVPRIIWVRLALALIGLVLFVYGVRFDDARIRLFGIGFLAVSAFLRWVKRERPPSA
jgi:hypothetical protein